MGLLDRKGNQPMSIEEFHKLEGIKKRDLEPNDKGIYITEAQLHEMPHSIDPSKQKISREQIRNSLSDKFKDADESTLEEYTDMAVALHLEDESQLDSFIAELVEKTKNTLKIESMDTSAISTEKEQTSKDSSFIPQAKTPTVPQNTIPKEKGGDLTNEGPEI